MHTTDLCVLLYVTYTSILKVIGEEEQDMEVY